VFRRFDFGKHLLDDAVLADQVGRAQDAHVFLPHHLLLTPHAIGFTDLVVSIRQQGVRQVILLLELQVRGGRISADTQDDNTGLLVGGVIIAQAAGLGGASGTVLPLYSDSLLS
jgi:hypothetical protein